MPFDATPTPSEDSPLGALIATCHRQLAEADAFMDAAERAAAEGRPFHAHQARRAAHDLTAQAEVTLDAVRKMAADMLAGVA